VLSLICESEFLRTCKEFIVLESIFVFLNFKKIICHLRIYRGGRGLVDELSQLTVPCLGF